MTTSFKIHEKLMPHRVQEILIISSPYDAFIMEEDGGLMEHVFSSYRGISLVVPPKFTVVSNNQEALNIVITQKIDLVVTMSRLLAQEIVQVAQEIKQIKPDLPVVLLAHTAYGVGKFEKNLPENSLDKIFIWSGNKNILWTIVKWVEDRLNAPHDTKLAMVRVIIFIEDSPVYYSSILPLLYESVIEQTSDVLGDTLNEEHRLLKLRARPKVLLASTHEEAMALYQQYRPYLLGVFSDIRFPINGEIDQWAGLNFLKMVKEEKPHLPCLLISTDVKKRIYASEIPVYFMDKNSPALHEEIRDFLLQNLGFGDFVFRLPTGEEVARARNLSTLEKVLKTLPDESLRYHTSQNHFSGWLMARAEIALATIFQSPDPSIDIHNMSEVRHYLQSHIKAKRLAQQRGVIASFHAERFDDDYEFLKIGEGSLGGKARGLAFISRVILDNQEQFNTIENVEVKIPQTVVFATDCFDQFIIKNRLRWCAKTEMRDEDVARLFLAASLPDTTEEVLRTIIEHINSPIAVRSSSLLEDSQFQPYAGLYSTFMLPNNHPDIEIRLDQLRKAIKLVYASVYYKGPKAFSKSTQHRTEEEKMGIVIQPITGEFYGNNFYPAISGTAQSYNYYPVGHMQSEDGLANIGIGLGKIVVEEGQVIRFSPTHPQFLPQFSSVDDLLKNSQSYFYALNLNSYIDDQGSKEDATLIVREIIDAIDEKPIKQLCSTYIASDHRVRDSYSHQGTPVATLATLLKYDQFFSLPKVLDTILKLGKESLGSDFEMEFAFNLSTNDDGKYEFIILQIRPAATHHYSAQEITQDEIQTACAYSTNALGESIIDGITKVIFVRPETFSPHKTVEMRAEVAKFNAELEARGEKYLLVGPGRWGSSDRYLGIPVGWQDISGVRAIVEASTPTFRADPSQGTHFFQNITSLGIAYITIYQAKDFFHWDFFQNPVNAQHGEFVDLITLDKPLIIKINAKTNEGIITGME